MRPEVTRQDIFGLVRPVLDAHTLGISSVEQILRDCGLRAVVADAAICEAVGEPSKPESIARLERWIRERRITRLGFSYRLDPRQGAEAFGKLLYQLHSRKLLAEQEGPLAALYFAGLPEACRIVKREHGDLVEVFLGDETPGETLDKLGVAPSLRPREMTEEIAYDDARLAFARDLLRREKHHAVKRVNRAGYEGFGTRKDLLVARVRHGLKNDLPPLMRAHVGPYLPDRIKAVHLFLDWARQLAQAGFLDILSIGTSQLSQSNFGEDWGDKPNGGGVPLNSPEEFRAVWDAARPMLVRTYAGTKNVPQLARMCEETINMAWHALSFWWFSQMDGRGPYPVRENLEQHTQTLRFVAESGKPFEPNIPHHFAFRGADDVTYVVSAVLAARTAKLSGVRHFVLQAMLNTPKATWGVQDLAKARALLTLVRELEDENFSVFLQPRAGLDYFSHDLEKAKVQLAAVSALMDDIEPHDPHSPPIIHVVSYSEASHLADPAVVNESIQITRAAIEEYRRLRGRGEVEDMAGHAEARARTDELLEGGRAVLQAIESAIPRPYSAQGLYQVFRAGFLPVPYLWECRDEFRHAVQWQTRVVKGSVKVVDETGRVVPPHERGRVAAEMARNLTQRSRNSPYGEPNTKGTKATKKGRKNTKRDHFSSCAFRRTADELRVRLEVRCDDTKESSQKNKSAVADSGVTV